MLPQVIKERLTCTFTSTGYKNDKGMEKKIFGHMTINSSVIPPSFQEQTL
jgi:hypothetical protein